MIIKLCRMKMAAVLGTVSAKVSILEGKLQDLQERQQLCLTSQQLSLSTFHQDLRQRLVFWEACTDKAMALVQDVTVRLAGFRTCYITSACFLARHPF
jgi:hypothetical protein